MAARIHLDEIGCVELYILRQAVERDGVFPARKRLKKSRGRMPNGERIDMSHPYPAGDVQVGAFERIVGLLTQSHLETAAGTKRGATVFRQYSAQGILIGKRRGYSRAGKGGMI